MYVKHSLSVRLYNESTKSIRQTVKQLAKSVNLKPENYPEENTV